jgi:hypothetical protein
MITRRTRVPIITLVLMLACAATARAQAVIKVNDDVNFKFGFLGQVQADWLTDPVNDSTAQNLFIRRVRLMFGGQVAKNVTFFAETDSPNLGKTLSGGKNITPSIIVQDAFGTFKASDAFMLDVGLMFVPYSRQSIQAAATLLALDYSGYAFTQSAATQSSTGRDTGFQGRGYLDKGRFEYRLGVFSGARDTPRSQRALRFGGRAQYEFFETEGTGYFYTGTYLGKKKVLSVGAAFDVQKDYNAWDGDVFVDYPMGKGAFTGQLDYNFYNGGTFLTTLPKQHVIFGELGYLLKDYKLTPVLQFGTKDITATDTGDENRWSIGANYWWAAHNANIKAAWGQIKPHGVERSNEFTVQFQFFYY